MTAIRQDLVKSAVSFLQDPKVQSAPLAKRVAFLESKGLTTEEIEEGIRQANGSAPSTTSSTTAIAQAPAGQYYVAQQQAPPLPARDWRDYFIMAVVTGGLGFGVYTLAKRYVAPLIKPPSKSSLEADKESLNAQFDAAAKLLEELQADTSSVKTAVEEQKAKVDETIDELESVIKELKEGDEKREEDFKNLKSELDTVREMIPKLMEKNKDAQTASLSELQTELKSLKSLFINRRIGAPTGASGSYSGGGGSGPGMNPPAPSSSGEGTGTTTPSVTTPLSPSAAQPSTNSFPGLGTPGATGRPAIPAWQLAAAKSSTSANNNAAAVGANAAGADPSASSLPETNGTEPSVGA